MNPAALLLLLPFVVSAPAADWVVASVGGEPVLHSDVVIEAAVLLAREGRDFRPAGGTAGLDPFLDRVIAKAALRLEAQRSGRPLSIEPEMVTRAVAELRRALGGDGPLSQFLRFCALDPAALSDWLREELALNAFIDEVVRRRAAPGPDEVAAEVARRLGGGAVDEAEIVMVEGQVRWELEQRRYPAELQAWLDDLFRRHGVERIAPPGTASGEQP